MPIQLKLFPQYIYIYIYIVDGSRFIIKIFIYRCYSTRLINSDRITRTWAKVKRVCQNQAYYNSHNNNSNNGNNRNNTSNHS